MHLPRVVPSSQDQEVLPHHREEAGKEKTAPASSVLPTLTVR